MHDLPSDWNIQRRFGLRDWTGPLICLLVFALPKLVAESSEKAPSRTQQSGESDSATKSKKTTTNEPNEPVPNPEELSWHPLSSKVATVLTHPNRIIFQVALAPNGKWLATGGVGFVDVWSAKDWSVKMRFPTSNPYCQMAWSPQADHVAYANSDNSVTVRSVTNASVLFRLMDLPGRVLRIAWSPDGNWLAAGGFGGKVSICDVERQKTVRTLETDGETIWALSFSPDSAILGIRTQGESVLLWDRTRDAIRFRLSEQGVNGARIEFSPDGKLFATTSRFDRTARCDSVVIRETASGNVRQTIKSSGCSDVAWAPDGRFIVLNLQSHLQLHAPDTGKLLHKFRCATGWIRSMSLARDAMRLATVDSKSNLVVWDFSSIDELRKATEPVVPNVATVKNRYSDLLQIHRAPNDEAVFGNFYEFGHRKDSETRDEGYWVYSAPHWYVFADSRIKVYRPPNPLPQPIKLPSGKRRVWLAFPGSI